MRGLVLLCLLLLGGATTGFGQDPAVELSNLRARWIRPLAIGQLVDSLSVVPHSVRIRLPDGSVLPPTDYELRGRLLLWNELPAADSVRLYYRILPFDLQRTAQLLDTSQLQRDERGILIGSYTPGGDASIFGDDPGLQYNGSFSRGISVGNRQDFVLNASFNLQLAGELGNGIEVAAAITDDNLPIQPEGNTQQLREFDKVFIRLRKDNNQLTAGDYELRNPDGHFLRYFRKLEGATATTARIDGDTRWESSASIAVARGRFTRRQIDPLEGNQGPYKLRGSGGERFLIILAGTERIFLDGELLQRGRDADYVIDYNLAELTFTTRRLITKDSRIVVEYEFADQRYLRSLYAADTRYSGNKGEVYLNFFSEQDSKNGSGDQGLTALQRAQLAAAGDTPGGVPVSTIDSLDATAEQRATYTLVDSLLRCAGRDTLVRFLRYTTDPAVGRLVARFSFVGEGQGDYVLETELLANERIYRYVSPDTLTCQPRGGYAPLTRLDPPRQQRLLTVGGEYRLGTTGSLRAELAGSQEDLNRFSLLDAEDDRGWAARLDYEQRIPLGDSSRWVLSPRAGYERVQADFRPTAPYRSPEFYRDWNLTNVLGQADTETATEQLFGAELGLQRADWGTLAYTYGSFDREERYQGRRHGGALALRRPTWSLTGRADYLDSREADRRGRLWRPTAELRKRFLALADLEFFTRFERERSERRAAGDSLSDLSYWFDRYGGGLATPAEREAWGLEASWNRRQDFRPLGTSFREAATADEARLAGRWRPGTALRMNGNFTYRRLLVSDPEFTTQEPGETFLGRLDLNTQLWDGLLRSTTTYELGSGQEPRVDFTYLYVGPGQGQYIWLDSLYNNDGKIQPNEMELSPFPDIADYIRVSVFTDDFVRTDNVVLNQSIQFSPERRWRQAGGMRQFLAKFNAQSSLTINRKVRPDDGVQPWNPLQLRISDTSLVAVSAVQRHSLFFNRTNPRFDAQLQYTDRQNRNVLVSGYESRRQQSTELALRLRPNRQNSVLCTVERGRRGSDSEFFDAKDFEIYQWRLSPEWIFQPGQDFRIRLIGTLGWEENRLEAGEGQNSRRREVELEGNYQQWLRAGAGLVDIGLEGKANSPVGFALLNGLQPGRNWLWNVAATRQLGTLLQLTLSYEGRQTGEAPTSHVGRAQVTAIF